MRASGVYVVRAIDDHHHHVRHAVMGNVFHVRVAMAIDVRRHPGVGAMVSDV